MRCASCLLQGFLQTALVVSSFHVLDTVASDGMAERVVRILYGEGDRFGCWLDVALDAIVWHRLKDDGQTGAEATQQDSTAAGAAAVDGQQVMLGIITESGLAHAGWCALSWAYCQRT